MCGRFEWVLFINDLFQGGCCNSFNLQWRLSCAATLSYSLITFFFRAAVATDSFYNGGFMCGRLVSALIAGFVRPRKGKEIYLNLSIYLSIYPCEPSCLSVWLVVGWSVGLTWFPKGAGVILNASEYLISIAWCRGTGTWSWCPWWPVWGPPSSSAPSPGPASTASTQELRF